jgi:uncharacterized repeat protein (TIGR03803 family)
MPRFLRKCHSLVVLVVIAVASLAANCWAGTESTILTFPFGGGLYPGGAGPYGGLVSDASGNLYGTTLSGGKVYNGVVFELVPSGAGTYKEVVLYSFRTAPDCNMPTGRLLLDSAGKLYGVAIAGCENGHGGVFELSPLGGGKYSYSVIYSFTGEYVSSVDSPVSMDSAGNIYGSLTYGGSLGEGQVYQLTPNGSGGWKPKVIYNFGHSGDGLYPTGPLTLDAAGNIYGTTPYGGSQGTGTVYELSPSSSGTFKEKILHNFQGSTDGGFPLSGVILDPAGDLFGTTDLQSVSNGTVFRLALSGSTWLNHVIHTFSASSDGSVPSEYGSLTLDASGNIYGATYYGGTDNFGTVFKLSPSGGSWTEAVLYSFTGKKDGAQPNPDLLLTSSGKILGTTFTSGATNLGTVFEITP